jgi:hypothetical protein
MLRTTQRKWALCLTGAAVAVASLATADVVILNPAQMTGTVSFNSETVSSYTVRAESDDGFSATGSFTSSQYSLTVESGHAYRPYVTAYFNNPTAHQSYLQVNRSTALAVDNQVGPTTVNFNYPTTHHVNFAVNVTGGTISYYTLNAQAGSSAGTEGYYAYTYSYFSSPQPSSTTSWLAMVPNSQVGVWGTVYLIAADGTQVQRSLSMQTADVSSGPATVSWNIDLTNTGVLAGDIELTGNAPDYHYVYVEGVYNTPTQGIYGSKYVAANDSYTMELLPGEYDVYLRTYFTSPWHYFDTKRYHVTVSASQTTTRNFIETLGTGQVPLVVSGFFTNADLDHSYVQIRSQENGWAYNPSLTNGQYAFSVQSGTWQRYMLYWSMSDSSNPQLPINTYAYRYHLTDSNVAPVVIAPAATENLGTEHITLVKTNAYFDVAEPVSGSTQIPLSNPYVYLTKNDYNEDGTQKSAWWSHASGSSQPLAMSALTLVAEPGTYSMQAFATVNGSQTQFNAQYITFGAPVTTSPGTNVSVPAYSGGHGDVAVNLTFSNVQSGGVTTVVETPLGPAAPEGFKAHCDPNETPGDLTCDPIFYDIKTTATFDTAAGVVVCIRKTFQESNALGNFLRLYHYEESEPDPAQRWKELAAPPLPLERVTDCADPDKQQVCGCSEPGCGVDIFATNPQSVIMLCGVTHSFSPFALFKGKLHFTNKVNGVTYEGPNGPPSPQTWTVPGTGKYRITATGARGGTASSQTQVAGGCGAEMSGEFVLQQGDTLNILVGQKGTTTPYSGGGGGGSFVASQSGAPLLVAGGGGGVRSGATVNGRHGSTLPGGVAGSVSSSYTSSFVAGGTNGSGGARASSYGSGGGGWSGNGAADGSYGEGGFSYLSGAKGGFGRSCGGLAHGGYGGGGAGNGCYGGGGGGGYSGGGGGRVAGGGGSWNAGASRVDQAGICTPSGHGQVSIEFIGH